MEVRVSVALHSSSRLSLPVCFSGLNSPAIRREGEALTKSLLKCTLPAVMCQSSLNERSGGQSVCLQHPSLCPLLFNKECRSKRPSPTVLGFSVRQTHTGLTFLFVFIHSIAQRCCGFFTGWFNTVYEKKSI